MKFLRSPQVQKKKIALDDDMMKAAWLGKRDVVSRLLEQKADIRYQETLRFITANRCCYALDFFLFWQVLLQLFSLFRLK